MELVGGGGMEVEKLRPLVGGRTAWDYCILWRISQDHKFLEWGGCCCNGADVQGDLAPPDPVPCRDLAFQHARTRVCEILASVPSLLLLESSGIHAEALMSNAPRWLLCVDPQDLGGVTKVLVPVEGGLVELFAARQEAEDQRIVDFIASQFAYQHLHHVAAAANMDAAAGGPHQWLPPPSSSSENPNFGWVDLSLDPVEGSAESVQYAERPPPKAMDDAMLSAETGMASAVKMQKREMMMMAAGDGRVDSGCSDGSNIQGNDDEEQQQKVGRSGRKLHSKNLLAERKRRKKLNDRLFALRSLVPIITKMDRASILGDAIEFVKKLQSQVKELQEELENTSPEDNEEEKQLGDDGSENNNVNVEGDMRSSAQNAQEESVKGTGCSSSVTKVLNDPLLKPTQKTQVCDHDNGQHQMEVQVEVFQVSRNEFFVKVFSEHKMGGFVRLMEAMNALGLEVTNANVTTFRPLVLSVFRVETEITGIYYLDGISAPSKGQEKRDNEEVEAEQVKESLIQLTRDSQVEWADQRGLEGAGECQQLVYNDHQHHLTSHQHHFHYIHNHL